jgi:hypothetical protein
VWLSLSNQLRSWLISLTLGFCGEILLSARGSVNPPLITLGMR